MGQVHVAPSTKILDVQQRTPGGRFAFTALPAGSYTLASHPITTYGDVFDLGDWSWLQVIQDIYANPATDAGDVLDCGVEFSTDGTNFFAGGLFTQCAGNLGAVRQEVMWFIPGLQLDPDAIFVAAAAAAVVDEKFFGRYMRIAVGVTDNDTNGVHQFKVTAYIK